MNADTPPNEDGLVKVPFTETIPELSWYRFTGWPKGQYKRFRHFHTACCDIEGFEFYHDMRDSKTTEYLEWRKSNDTTRLPDER